MPKAAIKIGPADNGRKMSLEDFDHVEVQNGFRYELSRGVITVSDVPNLVHMAVVDATHLAFSLYRGSHPGKIYRVAEGNDCKILLDQLESERHPDVAIYKNPPSGLEAVWSTWIPDLVIEVVSPESIHRDYIEKREEYLHFGIREYWIIDADRQEVLVLRRRSGRWVEKVIRPPAVCQTKLLPGFELNVGAVFREAEAARRLG